MDNQNNKNVDSPEEHVEQQVSSEENTINQNENKEQNSLDRKIKIGVPIAIALILFLIIGISRLGNNKVEEEKNKDCITHSYGEWYKDDPCDTLEWKKCKYCDKKDFRIVDAGHETNSSGVCVNCGKKITYTQEEVKNIIQIQLFALGEYDGGALLEIKIVFKNTSQKEIDEIFFGVTGYYNGESDVYRCTYPGNVKPGAVAGNGHYYEPLWPSEGMYGVGMSSIVIIYTDGTEERIFDDNVKLAFWDENDDNQSKEEEVLDDGSADVKVGDVITFGSYEQDNNSSNGKEEITWIVLKVENGKALLISEYALDSYKYYSSLKSVTWETSHIRQWLNSDFLSSAFSSDEQSSILSTEVLAESNPKHSSNQGTATVDKVFLLSAAQAERYFTNKASRTCKATQYAKQNGVWISPSNGNASWWLRTIGDRQDCASTIESDGDIYYTGSLVHSANPAVRPAIWVDLSNIQ